MGMGGVLPDSPAWGLLPDSPAWGTALYYGGAAAAAAGGVGAGGCAGGGGDDADVAGVGAAVRAAAAAAAVVGGGGYGGGAEQRDVLASVAELLCAVPGRSEEGVCWAEAARSEEGGDWAGAGAAWKAQPPQVEFPCGREARVEGVALCGYAAYIERGGHKVGHAETWALRETAAAALPAVVPGRVRAAAPGAGAADPRVGVQQEGGRGPDEQASGVGAGTGAEALTDATPTAAAASVACARLRG
eukprot:1064326-Pelagomonas_calceolata.AAC.1